MRDSIFPDVNKAHSADTTGDNSLGPDSRRASAHGVLAHRAPERSSALEHRTTSKAFPPSAVTVPPGSHVHILLDRKTLTTAYPQLTVSGGKGAHIRLTYSEALYDKDEHKGDRDDVGDRIALGLTDSFLPDGGAHRTFEPLWWRTWRYLDLDITTGDEPLTLESLTANFTAYPFEERATFQSADPDLAKIWEISWRTARLDAHETYMDTPYYEQLQYIGDTRIQALISYAVAGDDRLARQALAAFDDSRSPDGLTRSRYPSSLPQTIPTFSLLWIGMLHDYWMYRPDPEPVRASLARHPRRPRLVRHARAARRPARHSCPGGASSTGSLPAKFPPTTRTANPASPRSNTWARSMTPPISKRLSATRSSPPATATAPPTSAPASTTSAGTPSAASSPTTRTRKSSASRPTSSPSSTTSFPKDRQQEVLRKMLAIEPGTTPDGVLSASYYFRFYLARALDHAGMADEYLDSLDPWRKLLPLHFSTWPEIPGDTRSDSHAWTAHPIYDLLTLVAGIEPASPGFATVRIAPHLGTLTSLTATFPHPDGNIAVEYHRQGAGLDADITLPGKLTGNFVCGRKSLPAQTRREPHPRRIASHHACCLVPVQRSNHAHLSHGATSLPRALKHSGY